MCLQQSENKGVEQLHRERQLPREVTRGSEQLRKRPFGALERPRTAVAHLEFGPVRGLPGGRELRSSILGDGWRV